MDQIELLISSNQIQHILYSKVYSMILVLKLEIQPQNLFVKLEAVLETIYLKILTKM